MKIVEFLIGEADDTGVKTISLVDKPAMESEFIAFNKNEKPKPKYISLAKEGEEYKQIVAGLSMIPDKLIYRLDPDTGEEYKGYFSQATIEEIRNKYHKEMMTSNVNLDHDENTYINAYLVESYLLSTQERVDEVTGQGIEGATLGAWYTQFKIEDKEIFQRVLDGDFKGFSIEAYLEKELTASFKNNFKEIEKKMKKGLIEKFKDFLITLEAEESEVAVVETVEITLEDALVPEEGFTITWGEVEAEVTKTYINEAEEEVTEPVGQGEFTVEDGRVVVVDENSMLIEVREAPAEEEAPAEDAVETPAVEEETAEVVAAEVVAEEEAEEEVAEEGMPDAVKAWLTQIAGEFDDGEIYVSFQKQGGELTYGSVSTWANIKMTTDLVAEKKALEVKLAEPIAEPVLTDSTITSKDIKELTVYEAIARRKGIATV